MDRVGGVVAGIVGVRDCLDNAVGVVSDRLLDHAAQLVGLVGERDLVAARVHLLGHPAGIVVRVGPGAHVQIDGADLAVQAVIFCPQLTARLFGTFYSYVKEHCLVPLTSFRTPRPGTLHSWQDAQPRFSRLPLGRPLFNHDDQHRVIH